MANRLKACAFPQTLSHSVSEMPRSHLPSAEIVLSLLSPRGPYAGVCQLGPENAQPSGPRAVNSALLTSDATNSTSRPIFHADKSHSTAWSYQRKALLRARGCIYFSTVFLYSTGGMMKHLVRVYNERDRRTPEWLRRHVSDSAIAVTVERCAGSGKPYLSAVCKHRSVKTPVFSVPHRQTPSPVAEESLAAIRSILPARSASMVSKLGAMR